MKKETKYQMHIKWDKEIYELIRKIAYEKHLPLSQIVKIAVKKTYENYEKEN